MSLAPSSQSNASPACLHCGGTGKFAPVDDKDSVLCNACDGAGIQTPTASDLHRVRGKAYETQAAFFDLQAKVARLEIRIFNSQSVRGKATEDANRELHHALGMADRYRELAAAQFALARA